MSKKISNDLSLLKSSDFVIVLGEPLFLNETLQTVLNKSGAYIAYMNPMDYKSDALTFSQYIKYEVGSEEGICALLLEFFAHDLTPEVQAYIDELDIGYLSAETSVGEEEFEEMVEASKGKQNVSLVLSVDVIHHKNRANILKLLALLNQYSTLNIVIADATSSELEAFDNADTTSIEEVEELDSFNGVAIYANRFSDKEYIIGGSSFARVAKISDANKVVITFENTRLEKEFKLDTNLQGMVALCHDDQIQANDYSYKQVKIEKVDA